MSGAAQRLGFAVLLRFWRGTTQVIKSSIWILEDRRTCTNTIHTKQQRGSPHAPLSRASGSDDSRSPHACGPAASRCVLISIKRHHPSPQPPCTTQPPSRAHPHHTLCSPSMQTDRPMAPRQRAALSSAAISRDRGVGGGLGAGLRVGSPAHAASPVSSSSVASRSLPSSALLPLSSEPCGVASQVALQGAQWAWHAS